ncbi:MAG TPA: bifunctional phosphoribosylaminoimidazolecarboxamide formyltransferase/IMP cyclohydrolase [Actinomycetota bacterium]
MSDVRPIRRAILAPFDKTGLVTFATALVDRGVELVASGGTAKVLVEAELPVTPVEEVTGSPEMLGGRVKTLHPKIHGGLLADRRDPEHVRQLEASEISPFDLLVGGLYPFRETVASGADPDTVVENIDIGGPAMMRAAAKNFESVTVVVDPAEYEVVLAEIDANDGVTRATRRRLAAAAFAHTAAYDAAVAGWFAQQEAGEDALPGYVGLAYEKVGDLRYGENPHQRGGLYREAATPGPLGGASVLQGKDMSFNNWLDAYAAYDLVAALPAGSTVIVKHNNPCGAASLGSPAASYLAAFECDSVSAFGGIVAFRDEVDADAVAAMAEVFTEVVIAPSFSAAASAGLAERSNLRVVAAPLPDGGGLDVRPLPGGALVQDRDLLTETRAEWTVVSDRAPTDAEWSDLALAWTIAWRVKSNTIVLVKDGATVGIGAGQMSRVDSSWIATRKAGDRAEGSVLASDAFFPFPDALEVAADAGCTAVIHPGGSKGDDVVLAAAEAHGMAVVTTGTRHFRH